MGNGKTKLVLLGSICLTDIPRECIKVVEKNGKKYLNLAVIEMSEPSKFGDTHFISCAPKKEERKEGVNYIIGNFRKYVERTEHISQTDIDSSASLDDNDELPF